MLCHYNKTKNEYPIDRKKPSLDGYFSTVLVCFIFKVQKRLCRFLIRCKGTAFFYSPQEQIYVVQHVLPLFCLKICLITLFAD